MAFDFEQFLKEKQYEIRKEQKPASQEDFYVLCRRIRDAFNAEWQTSGSSQSLDIQKRAIIGYAKEKDYFKKRIDELISQFGCFETEYPAWYEDLTEAVYQENWGLCGLSEWFSSEYRQSSSAKIIGENIYFMCGGRMQLMPQTISPGRFMQLLRAIMLNTPGERMDKSYYELYLLDGTRVTIFTEPLVKKGRQSLILRRYLVPNLSFEEQESRGTIPKGSSEFFRTMAKIGWNTVFMGAVRTAKTTFLSTWQAQEDPTLEGVMVETDPEIPMHKILPGAPIIQLIADGEELRTISKSLLRSDADYFILAEARDGIALDTAVRIASKGTKRMKMTFHSRLPEKFPLEAATEIVKSTGGDIKLAMLSVAGAFDLILHFVQLGDKSRKRLHGIYSMDVDKDGNIRFETMCSYNAAGDSWQFYDRLCPSQEIYAMESEPELYSRFRQMLKDLSKRGEIK